MKMRKLSYTPGKPSYLMKTSHGSKQATPLCSTWRWAAMTAVCLLVGLYILHKLTTAFPNGNIGLYRDDGLAAFRNTSARSLDKARKDFSKILGELGL